MALVITEVSSKKDIKAFVQLPFLIYKGNPYWVPPMVSDEEKALLPSTNPAFEFSKAKFWLVYKDGICVGRIGAIVNSLAIEKTGEKLGRLTRTEFIDDKAVVDLLFETAESWLKSEGMDGVHGPLGFSNLDHQGLLIEGHNYLPSVASDYHQPYYGAHFERLGYVKEKDWLEFRVTFPEALPEKSFVVAEMLMKRYGLKALNFTQKSELEQFKQPIFDLFNEAFTELFSTFKLSQKMIDFYVSKYFPLLNPRYVKVIVDKEDKIAGFLVALPSLSKAMQRANGKLLPFGWWHIMQALKKPCEMDLMLTGVRPDFQKLGVAALLMNDLWKTANSDGVKYVETTGMLEDNHVAIQMWKSFEHIQHKRKRCYTKRF